MAYGRSARRGRISQREQLEQNNAWDRFYAAAADKEPRRQAELPPKRERIKRPIDQQPVAPLEKDIQKAILQAIALRRDVIFVGRFNRGQAVATDGYGATRYTQFNTVAGFPDIHGLLVGGRAFYIEVKRPHPHYRRPDKPQQDFLDAARVAGACAGVACSVEEALALLPPDSAIHL